MKRILLGVLAMLATLCLTGCDEVNRLAGEAYLQATKGDQFRAETFTVLAVTRVSIQESWERTPSDRQVFTVRHGSETVYLECTATFVQFPIKGH
jgi:outer membrane lipoprotein SlyB